MSTSNSERFVPRDLRKLEIGNWKLHGNWKVPHTHLHFPSPSGSSEFFPDNVVEFVPPVYEVDLVLLAQDVHHCLHMYLFEDIYDYKRRTLVFKESKNITCSRQLGTAATLVTGFLAMLLGQACVPMYSSENMGEETEEDAAPL